MRKTIIRAHRRKGKKVRKHYRRVKYRTMSPLARVRNALKIQQDRVSELTNKLSQPGVNTVRVTNDLIWHRKGVSLLAKELDRLEDQKRSDFFNKLNYKPQRENLSSPKISFSAGEIMAAPSSTIHPGLLELRERIKATEVTPSGVNYDLRRQRELAREIAKLEAPQLYDKGLTGLTTVFNPFSDEPLRRISTSYTPGGRGHKLKGQWSQSFPKRQSDPAKGNYSTRSSRVFNKKFANRGV